ncbi:MAG TPA: BamA/TamA family outer membrane protein [Longimicrobium sp.]|uniref:BamA/TamA family outer membrane protein n=1 Tax=Longimicrobium sp. TaxID=2029185 RepID=UPI002ED7F131
MLLNIALAALLQSTPVAQDTTAAYADAGTRQLVAAARDRRARVERTIDAYQVTAKQRAHVGVEALSRNRTLFGQEIAVGISWRRGQPGTVRVLGARESSPSTSTGLQLPGNLRGDGPDMAFDPDKLQLDIFSFGVGSRVDTDSGTARPMPDSVREGVHAVRDSTGKKTGTSVNVSLEPIDPLSAGSEAHYRFRSGDTTTVRLPDGTRLQMVQLEIIPRRREFNLLRGTLWIDMQSHGVVRSVMTTARPFDLQRDVEDIPGFLGMAGGVRATVRYVTVEYALTQNRFWLPRLMAVDMEANIGMLAGLPVRFERSYENYQVTASATPERAPLEAVVARRDTAGMRVCREQAKAVQGACMCSNGACSVWNVEIPTDTAALLASADLPPPLVNGSSRLITGEEVESLARVLVPGFGDAMPELHTEIASLRMLRYNRVEALSVGARADVEYGPLTVDGEFRIGLADREPKAELGVTRQTAIWNTRLAGYRRLVPFDPNSRALGMGNSLSALLLGRDEYDYFLASGAELTGTPIRTGAWTYNWRLFGEHQHPTTRNTKVTLGQVWDGGDAFREVRPAARADQFGAGLGLRRDFGSDRSPARLTTGIGLEAQTGTFEFGRGQAFARLASPLGGRLALALEGAAGTTTGDVPLQGLWYLGGTTTVRGYEGALAGGESFWRARAELATPTPAARLVLFSDAGWVGARDAWRGDPSLLSAGIGASLLDGLIRLDLSRAIREPKGWRVDLYLDAAL